MKKFKERNTRIVAAVSAAVLLLAVLVSLNTSKLPFINNDRTYTGYFANAVGMMTGDEVTVAGVKVGSVSSLTLDGNRVKVAFTVARGVHLGSQTSLDYKVLTPIGEQYLAVDPAGPGDLSGPVPLSRTTVPDTLVSDLNHLTGETQQINIAQLEQALNTTSASLQGVTPSTIDSALSGLAKFSAVLADHQSSLSGLLTQADAVTGVLSSHSAQLVDLVGQSSLILQVLDQRRQAIQQLLATTSTLGQQLDLVLGPNQGQLSSLLTSLQTVSAVLAKDSNALNTAVPLLVAFSRYGANAAGSGPFLDSVVPTFLIPDNLITQCAKKQPLNPIVGCRP
jgi:phospholipid/cholesterol/gamma-HCH transport system substrate-binding protein